MSILSLYAKKGVKAQESYKNQPVVTDKKSKLSGQAKTVTARKKGSVLDNNSAFDQETISKYLS